MDRNGTGLKWRRVLAACTVACGLGGAGVPAEAKGLPEYSISGGDLRCAIAVGIEGRIRGWVSGPGRPLRASPPLGRAYDLEVRPLPGGPGNVRWTYYPSAGGAVTGDSSWVPLSPALNRLFSDAIDAGCAGHAAALRAAAAGLSLAMTAALLLFACRVSRGAADYDPRAGA